MVMAPGALTACYRVNIRWLSKSNRPYFFFRSVLENTCYFSIAKGASHKLGVLFLFRRYFTHQQLFRLYVGTIRPCMEYCSHIWGSSPGRELLDSVHCAVLTFQSYFIRRNWPLPSLALRRDVASLSLFYRYYFGRCSAELYACIPPPLARPRASRQASQSHQYSVAISHPRIERL